MKLPPPHLQSVAALPWKVCSSDLLLILTIVTIQRVIFKHFHNIHRF